MSEADIQRGIVNCVKRWGGFAVKVKPGVASAGKGFPDLLLILPNGRVLFCEVKQPGKTQTPIQKWWERELRIRGHSVVVMESAEQLMMEVLNHGR